MRREKDTSHKFPVNDRLHIWEVWTRVRAVRVVRSKQILEIILEEELTAFADAMERG